MPEDALAILFGGGQVYRVDPSGRNDHIERLITYRDRDILQSGWLIGERYIANKAAMAWAVTQPSDSTVWVPARSTTTMAPASSPVGCWMNATRAPSGETRA